MSKINDVSEPCYGYTVMKKWWPLIIDLLGGTERMREVGETWLPREGKETTDQYRERLKMSFLYSAFEDAVNDITNRPFAEPVTVSNLPEGLLYLMSNTDGLGTSFGSFLRSVFCDLVTWGIAHILVDHSVVTRGDWISDEIAEGARVMYSRINPTRLIGWREDGQGGLSQLRYQMDSIEPNGDFGDEVVNKIRVWSKADITDYVQNREGKWVPETVLPHTFGRIPLVTINVNPHGFMVAKPPLLNLAWLNCRHWQSSSEQARILQMARFAILFGKGFIKSEIKDGIDIGPMKGIFTTGDNGDMKYVEHSGKAIEAGSDDLKDIEMKMAVAGHRPYENSSRVDTAIGKKVNEERNVSQVKAWIRATEEGATQSLMLAGEWRKLDTSETSVDIYSDFDVSLYGSGDKEHLLDLHRDGVLSKEALLHEEKRRGILGEKYSVEDHLRMIDEEAGREVLDELSE